MRVTDASLWQDVRRMTLAIFHLSEFIRTWAHGQEVFTANLLGILAPAGINVDDFWMQELPQCMQNFCRDPVHANQKKIRCARFKDMVNLPFLRDGGCVY